MPESKSRHAHKHLQQQVKPGETRLQPASKNENRIISIAVLFFAVLGLAIGFFIDASSIAILIACAAVGAGIGLLAGRQFKKTLSGK